MHFFRELQRRNVFRVATAYVVVAWILMQVGAALEPAMYLPDWVDSVLAFFLLLGFPVALIVAWVYELTPEGLKREGEIDPDAPARVLAARRWDRLIMVALVLAVGYFALDKYVLNEREPVRLAETGVQQDVDRESGRAGTKIEPVDNKSIAVLPFVNMSSDPEQAYFSDGLTEELLNLLTGIGDLKVAARTSTFYYKDKLEQVTLAEIAKQLGVANVLEGSVRKSDGKIRITAQLIKADDGFHLWSQTYDRGIDDVFAIQDEISAAVVNALKVVLLGHAPHATAIDTESYELSMQARFLFNRRGPGDLEQALDLFVRAAELDPRNATAWVGMTPLYLWLFDPPRVEKAAAAVEKALALEPNNLEAQLRKASVLFAQGNGAAAEEMVQHVYQANPDNPLVMTMVAGWEFDSGNFDRAIELQRRAISMDPLHVVNLGNLAFFLIGAGRWDDAEPLALKMRQLAPDVMLGLDCLLEIRLLQGKPGEALALLNQIDQQDMSSEEIDWLRVVQTLVLHSVGDEQASLKVLESFRQSAVAESKPVWMAYMHAWRGETEQAFEWLQRAVKNHSDGDNLGIVMHPFLYSLHADPRWAEVIAQLRDT